ncbi:N-acetyltransferase [Hoeflea sp. G2-23]|uniref:N-acetyltransferase n=1 Tax=Hoeflea algicola TaxID=2983763 RepID=A0ABT3Z9G5_9HYPH|nr:N-acetyltransferase [Hoeflea algicola]MCY0148403.1 N-acetyltransferase [Hoeflea algicola]
MTGHVCGFGKTGFAIENEIGTDRGTREAMLDRAMGPGRKRKSSEKLRRGMLPSSGLAFVARDSNGTLIGSVRLWDVAAGGRQLLLLGPLAVASEVAGRGIGSALMRHAIDRATELGHGAIMLVGDAAYYSRFGFSVEKTGGLIMPGPVERSRLLGCELLPGYLDEVAGLLVPNGRLAPAFVRRTRSARLMRVA